MAIGCVSSYAIAMSGIRTGLLVSLLFAQAAAGADVVHAHNLEIPFDGTPGPLNAITYVEGVTVGHETIIKVLRERNRYLGE